MTSPAQVSGPGALSARTDTGGQPIRNLPNPDYGEATEYREQQKGAPLSATPSTPTAPVSSPQQTPAAGGAPAGQPPVPLFAPSQRPDEPITAGVPFGPGPSQISPGPQAGSAYTLSTQMSEYANADSTGNLAWLANFLYEQGL